MLTHKRYKEGLYSLPSSSGIPGMHVTCGSSKGNHPSAQRSPLPWERQKGQRRHTPEPCGQDPQPGGNQKGLPTLLLAPVCTAMSSMSPGAQGCPQSSRLLASQKKQTRPASCSPTRSGPFTRGALLSVAGPSLPHPGNAGCPQVWHTQTHPKAHTMLTQHTALCWERPPPEPGRLPTPTLPRLCQLFLTPQQNPAPPAGTMRGPTALCFCPAHPAFGLPFNKAARMRDTVGITSLPCPVKSPQRPCLYLLKDEAGLPTPAGLWAVLCAPHLVPL